MNTPQLLAFHGDPAVKAKYLKRIRAHAKADEIVSGQYWEDGKGCAVGCTLHSDDHAAYETELGIPKRLAYLEDRIFERLYRSIDPVLAKAWPEKFLKAPKVGADLGFVFAKFVAWLLLDPTTGVIRHAKRPETKESIETVGALYRRLSEGLAPSPTDWGSARKLAWASYANAAAADAAAADADADADAAADNAAAAEDAADNAAAVEDAARLAFYRKNGYWPRYWYVDYKLGKKGSARYVQISEKLLELLAAA